MAGFAMCDACRAEYEDPANRRFHAQPTACAACGPRLAAADAAGRPVEVADPLAWFIGGLREGRIGAMKGCSAGITLVCDARNAEAVAELSVGESIARKKPLAVMVADVAAAEEMCRVSDAERELLASNSPADRAAGEKWPGGFQPLVRSPGNLVEAMRRGIGNSA